MKFINIKSILSTIIKTFCVIGAIVCFSLPIYAQDTNVPLFADDPSQCGYDYEAPRPTNCLFLEEPIGGKANWDLYTVHCAERPSKTAGKTESQCKYVLWNGGSVPQGDRGPLQAILTSTPSRPYEGPFGLLYSYVQLIYTYMSGLIVGISVLFVVIGGIQMSTAGGEQTKFDAGKKHITHAIVGLIIWFTASLLLYTINPTFFAF